MTATEVLQRLLDERGVEYRFNDATKVFEWHFDGTDGEGSAHATEVDGGVNIIACSITPEQAIAATLGDTDATGGRQGDADLAAENAKLRELIAEWYPHMKKRVGVDALWQWGHMAVIRELGVDVS